MKSRWFVAGTIALVLAVTSFGVSVLAKENENEEKQDGEVAVSWDKVPEAAQKCIQAQLGTNAPSKITQETEDGFTLYEAAQNVNGQLKEVKLGENGQLLEVEDAISLADLPPAVKATIEKKAPKAGIKEVVRVTCYYYEIEVGDGEHPEELKILGNGQEVEEED